MAGCKAFLKRLPNLVYDPDVALLQAVKYSVDLDLLFGAESRLR